MRVVLVLAFLLAPRTVLPFKDPFEPIIESEKKDEIALIGVTIGVGVKVAVIKFGDEVVLAEEGESIGKLVVKMISLEKVVLRGTGKTIVLTLE